MAIRLAQLITELDPGGAERVVYELATGLDPKRFLQVVVSLKPADGQIAEELAGSGVRVLSVGMRTKLDFFALWRLERILKEEAVQMLHTHLFHADILGRLAAAKAGVRAVISTAHVVEGRFRPWRHWVERATSHLVDAEVCVSEAVRRYMLEHGCMPVEKLRVIWNGVDPARFAGPFDRASIRRSLGIRGDEPLLLSVGRLRRQKGHDIALRAFAIISGRMPSARLLVAGDGPERKRLERLVRRLGLEGRACFIGQRRDVPELLAAADCVLMPSRYEGFGLAVAEAMAAGRPVVASRVDSLMELIEDGVSGLLVEPEDPQALAEGALKVLGSSSLAQSLGARGKARVVERFTLQAMLKAHEELYEMLAIAKGILA